MKKLLFILITGIITLTAAAQIPNYVPTNGLVGWWPFNGNANDESGNGNNGTVNGATLTTDRFGNANKAYSFDGVNNEIIVPDHQSLNFGTNPSFSINIWIKKALINSNGVFSKAQPYNGFGWNGWNYFNDDFQTGYPCLNNPIVVTVNNWTQVSFTVENGVVKKFVNAIYQGEFQCVNLMSNSISTNDDFHIGNARDLVNFFNGSLDDIGIWNRALTNCEIQDLYNAELNSLALNGGPDQELCEGQSTSLFGTGASTYQWSNNVQNGVGFVPTATNSYILTGTDANGCVGTDTVTVTVNEVSSSTQTQTALDSYTWPVNGQTYTQSGTYTQVITNAAGCDSTITLNLELSFTGMNALSNTNIVIAPNPANDYVQVTIPENLIGQTFILMDNSGRAILEGTFMQKEHNIDLKHLAVGMYVLKIHEGTEQSFRILKN